MLISAVVKGAEVAPRWSQMVEETYLYNTLCHRS